MSNAHHLKAAFRLLQKCGECICIYMHVRLECDGECASLIEHQAAEIYVFHIRKLDMIPFRSNVVVYGCASLMWVDSVVCD